jgi:hypothetical protein
LSAELICCELTAVVSLLCYFLCWIMILTAAGVMIGLANISAPERVSHYPHPRPEVERNVTATKRNPRLFMVVPKTKHGSPAKKAASFAALPTEKAGAKKSTHHKSWAGFNGGY